MFFWLTANENIEFGFISYRREMCLRLRQKNTRVECERALETAKRALKTTLRGCKYVKEKKIAPYNSYRKIV